MLLRLNLCKLFAALTQMATTESILMSLVISSDLIILLFVSLHPSDALPPLDSTPQSETAAQFFATLPSDTTHLCTFTAHLCTFITAP